MRRNPHIEALIFSSGGLEMDLQFALRQLMIFLSFAEEANEAGAVDFGAKRAELLPRVFSPSASLQSFTGRAYLNGTEPVPPGSFAHLRINGVMTADGGLCSHGMKDLAEDIEMVQANPHLSGLLLEIDSGGGETLAGTLILKALAQLEKPAVGYAHELASAAYKAALPLDYVVASGNEVKVGSIGTMISLNRKRLQKFMEEEEVIYANQSIFKNYEFRQLLQGNREPLLAILDQQTGFFVDEVRQYRPLPTATDEERQRVEGGGIFHASEAVRLGMIDAIGTRRDAINQLVALSEDEYFTKRAESQGRSAGASIQARHGVATQAQFPLHTNQDQMNGLEKFLAALIPALSGKYGLQVKEGATAQDVLDAIHAAQGIELVEEAAREQAMEQARTLLDDKLQSLEQQFAQMQNQLQEMQQSRQAAQGALEQERAKAQRQQEELLRIKGSGADQNQGAATGQAPKVTTFNTVTTARQTLEVDGEETY